MKSLRVKPDDIAVGQGLPWPMYDSEGRLLLEKGMVIANQSQLEALVHRGLYRQNGVDDELPRIDLVETGQFEDDTSPFLILDEMVDRLPQLFQSIAKGKNGVENNIIRFCKKLYDLCQDDPDVMLGAVHVFHKNKYTAYHPVHVVILIAIVGSRLGLAEDELMPVLAAGLTSNVSMNDLQEELFFQGSALSIEQKTEIDNHPENSVKMLVMAGVYNAKWLEVIIQHHERPDGSGYPNAIKEGRISREAQLVCIADRYSAMVSCRAYRCAKASNDALREFFVNKCDHCDEEMTLLFIKELGIWPPGTPVELVNGEIAIVIKRNKDSMWPVVSSIYGPKGVVYAHPLRRDCNYEDYRIKSVSILPDDRPLNLSMIWGYC